MSCNVGWGGDQPKMRDSVTVEGCLGPNAKLNIGDTQPMVFKVGEKPQFELETKQVLKKYESGKTVVVDGVKQYEEVSCVGQPKGLRQILWERGLWKENMVQKVKKEDGSNEDSQRRDDSFDMTKVLGNS